MAEEDVENMHDSQAVQAALQGALQSARLAEKGVAADA